MITQEQIFAIKQSMQEKIVVAEKELQQCIQEQSTLTDITTLSASVLRYEDLQAQLESYAQIFSFFAAPVESVLSPLVKAEVLEYVRAAMRVSPEIAQTMAHMIAEELRVLVQSQEDDAIDMIEAEYKVYILPAYVMTGLFSEINDRLQEMVRFCAQYAPTYGVDQVRDVLRYACELSIDMNESLDATIAYLRTEDNPWLREEDRVFLLDECEERLAELRFEKSKRQNLAHEKAIEMLERREEKTTGN